MYVMYFGRQWGQKGIKPTKLLPLGDISVLLRRKKENIHRETYKYHVKNLDNIS